MPLRTAETDVLLVGAGILLGSLLLLNVAGITDIIESSRRPGRWWKTPEALNGWAVLVFALGTLVVAVVMLWAINLKAAMLVVAGMLVPFVFAAAQSRKPPRAP